MSVPGIIRCPPYCRSNCAISHHPLLIALLNAVDSEDVELMHRRLRQFEEVFHRYSSGRLWSLHDDIPDDNEQYRLPIGHWACALGRVKVLEWILSQGFDVTTQCGSRRENMLHKALASLQETSSNEAAHKFCQMIPHMKDILCLGDALGFTILHTCCDMLRQDMARTDFFVDCLRNLVDFAKSHGIDFLSQFVNMRNHDGDTALHILAKSVQQTTASQILVEAHCNLAAVNKQGKTPGDLAVERGSTKMGMYLNQELSKRKEKHTSSESGVPAVTQIVGHANTEASRRLVSAEEYEQRRKKAIMKADSVKVTSRIGPITEVTQADGSVKLVIPETSRGIHIIPDGEFSSVTGAKTEVGLSLASNVALTTISSQGTKPSQQKNIVMTADDSDSDDEWVDRTEQEHSAFVKTKEGIAIPLSVKGTTFFNFIKACDSKTKESVYQSLAEEKISCENSITAIDQKYLDIKDKLDETQSRQKRSVDSIQNLLWRLNQLQEEESKLGASIGKGQKDHTATYGTLKGLKERLQHCQAALDALQGL